jgi:hypothetical protein
MYLTRCRGACGAHLVPRGEGMERRMYRPFSPGKSSGNRALPKRFIRAAASKKEEMKKEAEETRTPDSPPPKGRMDADHTQGMEEPTVSSSNSVDQPPEQRLSAEEIASRMAELRAAAKEQGNKDGGLFEVRLILSISYFVCCLICYCEAKKIKGPVIPCRLH